MGAKSATSEYTCYLYSLYKINRENTQRNEKILIMSPHIPTVPYLHTIIIYFLLIVTFKYLLLISLSGSY